MIPGWKFSNIGIIASFLVIIFVPLQERRQDKLSEDNEYPASDEGKNEHTARLLQKMFRFVVSTQCEGDDKDKDCKADTYSDDFHPFITVIHQVNQSSHLPIPP